MTREEAILSKIYEVCFSDKWLQFRADQGSRGQSYFSRQNV